MKQLPYIVWSTKNELGDPLVDEQHRSLVSLINSLHYFIQEDPRAEVMTAIKDSLFGYVKVHFLTEEIKMKKAKYPNLQQHRESHQTLTDKTRGLFESTGQTKDPNTILSFLKAWWLEHINIEDRKFSIYVRKG